MVIKKILAALISALFISNALADTRCPSEIALGNLAFTEAFPKNTHNEWWTASAHNFNIPRIYFYSIELHDFITPSYSSSDYAIKKANRLIKYQKIFYSSSYDDADGSSWCYYSLYDDETIYQYKISTHVYMS